MVGEGEGTGGRKRSGRERREGKGRRRDRPPFWKFLDPPLQPAAYMNRSKIKTTLCGTWYLPRSQVHNDRAVSVITVILHICNQHAQDGNISTSGLKSDATIAFLDPDFLYDAENFGYSAIK